VQCNDREHRLSRQKENEKKKIKEGQHNELATRLERKQSHTGKGEISPKKPKRRVTCGKKEVGNIKKA